MAYLAHKQLARLHQDIMSALYRDRILRHSMMTMEATLVGWSVLTVYLVWRFLDAELVEFWQLAIRNFEFRLDYIVDFLTMSLNSLDSLVLLEWILAGSLVIIVGMKHRELIQRSNK